MTFWDPTPNLGKSWSFMGVEDYDLRVICCGLSLSSSKDRFPKLKWLGIVDAEEQDAVVRCSNRIFFRNWHDGYLLPEY